MNKGFSLVELIVVIAIMAILVGVAVPVYTSYIKEAQDSVDEQFVDELERALSTAMIDVKSGLTAGDSTAEKWTVPTKIEIANGAVTATATVDGATVSCDGFVEVLASIITIPLTFSADEVVIAANGTITVTPAE